MKYYIFLDTETTGLPFEGNASVCELGAVCLDEEGYKVSEFSSLVKPSGGIADWSPEAMEKHGIPEEKLLDSPTPTLVWDKFYGWLLLHTPIVHVYAYNVAFDREMMRRTMPISDQLPWGNCAMVAAAKHIGGAHRKRIALAKACSHFGIERDELHRALGDARDLANVWLHLREESCIYL